MDKEAKEKEEAEGGDETGKEDTKPSQKVDWDGQVVDKKWYTRSVVILDYNITYGQLTAGFLAFVIIVVIVSIIAMACIYKHRETVKVGIVRASIAIRASLSRKSMGQIQNLPEDPEEQNKKMDDAVK